MEKPGTGTYYRYQMKVLHLTYVLTRCAIKDAKKYYAFNNQGTEFEFTVVQKSNQGSFPQYIGGCNRLRPDASGFFCFIFCGTSRFIGREAKKKSINY
jgi:hypothetical protein